MWFPVAFFIVFALGLALLITGFAINMLRGWWSYRARRRVAFLMVAGVVLLGISLLMGMAMSVFGHYLT